MIAPDLQLLKDGDREVRFAFRHKAGIFYGVLGAALVCAAVSGAIETLVARLVFGLFGAVIAIVGIIGLFKRFELMVNFSARTYRISAGFWPAAKMVQGSLDEIMRVTLTTRGEISDREDFLHESTVWVVSVNFRRWSGPISIFESYNELHAQNKLHYWAKRFGAEPVDLTAVKVEASAPRNPEALAKRARPAASAPSSAPTGFEVKYSAGITTIVLPRRKADFIHGLEFTFTIVLCSGFAALGLLFLFADPSRRSSETPVWMFHAISVIFLAVAGIFFFAGMKRAWGREVVSLDSAGLAHGIRIFGRVWDEVRLQR